MNEDNIKGGLEKTGGRIKEAAGALTGDAELKNEGRADQVSGGVKQAWGNLKDAAQSAVDSIKGGAHDSELDRTDRDPVV
jgi:uncharacterized protein YjbJ (UPF0337 family)